MPPLADDDRFVAIDNPRRVWAFSSIHGDAERLRALHDAVLEDFQIGDRIIYTGNYTGYGPYSAQTVDEILGFRRSILSIEGARTTDLVYLRGRQEDLWLRLMRLPFSPNPVDTLLWMMASGMANTFQSYGISSHDGIIAAREGTMFLTRWVQKAREAIRCHPGHEIFNTQFKRAAYTTLEKRYPMLFVSAGLDPKQSLANQDESLWWGSETFCTLERQYDQFEKVIRGYDPSHQGVYLNCVTASLDGGCGFGGTLVCASMSANGDFQDLLEA